MTDDLNLVILDYNWNRLWTSPNVIDAEINDELGLVGDASVRIPQDDEALNYIPDPNGPKSNEGRWQLYEGSNIVFAGVVDQTTRQISSDDTYTFGGKQRGILLGTTNVGRRDFDGWPVDLLYQELLYDNIAKAPLAVIYADDVHPLHPAVNCITGDPLENNYWAALHSGSNNVKIDLGQVKHVDAIRVIPPWWDQRWYKFTVETSTDDVAWTTRGSKTDIYPLSDRGKIYTFSGDARYVRVIMPDSTDQIARLAAVQVYSKMAEIGSQTTYDIPWIENDDSGNVISGGTTVRVFEQGAFNGDGVLGNSLVTRMSGTPTTGYLIHKYRGGDSGAYFTQGLGGGDAVVRFYVDGIDKGTAFVPSGTYQYKAFETSGLASAQHTMKVEQVTGTPQLDYFSGGYRASFRPIRDNDPSIGYSGNWVKAEGGYYSNFSAQRATVSGSTMFYDFQGDYITLISSKGPTFGKIHVWIDGSGPTIVDLYDSQYKFQQKVFSWSGSYGNHDIRAAHSGSKNASSTAYYVDVDGLEGNFSHILYLRSFYETNLRMITRLSEVTNSWLHFNHDGSIDLLGTVGSYSNTIIREGENEGGAIIKAEAQTDYSETCSAVLALVTGFGDVPIKAFVIDMNAVAKMGVKIRKAENADANDAYLLTRQAWSELQEYKEPVKRWSVEYDPQEIGGDLEVGETTILHSDRLNLTGGARHRIGKLTTTYTSD